MTWKQALPFIVNVAKDNKWVAITIAVFMNIVSIWLVFAIWHLIPTLHWADTPYAITAFIWTLFFAALTFGLCIEHHGEG